MKKTFLLLLLLPITLFSQELWPTSNAEWTYSTTDNQYFSGYSSYKIERDTLIQGNVCQIYSKHSKSYFSGIPGGSVQESNKDIHFIIRLTDSLLSYYNSATNQFDTIFNFAANTGDSWMTYDYQNCPLSTGNALTKVISKEMVVIEGRNLLKFTIQRITTNDTITETFHQLFGGQGCFVYNLMCTEDSKEFEIRCFKFNMGETDEFYYKPYASDCYNFPQLGVEDVDNTTDLTVINPSSGREIVFKNVKLNAITEIQIHDLEGKKISITALSEINDLISIKPTHFLNNGIYFFTIHFYNNSISNGKFVVLNE